MCFPTQAAAYNPTDPYADQRGAECPANTAAGRRLALLVHAWFEPDTVTDPSEKRWVRINPDSHDSACAAWLDGRLDTPDALDLDAALRLIAADLAAEGIGTDLDVRQAQALGAMARRMLGQPDLPAHTAAPTDATGVAPDGFESQDESRAPEPVHPGTPDTAAPLEQGG